VIKASFAWAIAKTFPRAVLLGVSAGSGRRCFERVVILVPVELGGPNADGRRNFATLANAAHVAPLSPRAVRTFDVSVFCDPVSETCPREKQVTLTLICLPLISLAKRLGGPREWPHRTMRFSRHPHFFPQQQPAASSCQPFPACPFASNGDTFSLTFKAVRGVFGLSS